MACCCELQNTLDVEVTQEALLDMEIGGSAGVLLQAKSVEVTENGTSVVAPDDGFDGLKSVEINTNVPKRFECGDAVFNTNGYNGSNLYRKITKINVSCLVTAQTKKLSALFNGLGELTEIIGLENWDTSNVNDIINMFNSCSSLQSVDVSGFDTSSVMNMFNLFSGCSSLQSVDVSGWDTSSVTNMQCAFNVCKSLQSVDVSGWDTSSVTNIANMFNGCIKLKSLIGDKTLQDVENGTVALRGIKVSISTSSSPLRFSSILALSNGLADLTGATAQTLTISASSYNNMYNDDDTITTADVIAERQARIAAICASKNWNFAH